MSDQEIKDGNKAISDFMNAECVLMKTASKPDGDYMRMSPGHGGYESVKYHSSWDWLMPVLEKIFVFDRSVNDVVIRPGQTIISMRYVGAVKSPCLPTNDSITEAFICVIEYLNFKKKQEDRKNG